MAVEFLYENRKFWNKFVRETEDFRWYITLYKKGWCGMDDKGNIVDFNKQSRCKDCFYFDVGEIVPCHFFEDYELDRNGKKGICTICGDLCYVNKGKYACLDFKEKS